VRAVDSISLSILPHSFAALVGPSGSGKTSLLSLLGLLDRPTSGSLSDAGREISNCSDYELARLRRRRGFVFQDFALLPKLDVLDNVCYPLIPRGLDRKRRTAIATHWLDRLGLASQVQSRPDELSGGECQRVALARALAGDPDILLADEPTSNLDDETKRSVRDLFCEVHRAGKTFVIATHDSELLSLATHVFYLRDGKLVSTST
jgi:putative ABC transport system ATP-binding protein